MAVDPLDGTTACATGRPGAVAVIALAEKGALFDPGPAFYMEKLAVGPAAAHVIDIRCARGDVGAYARSFAVLTVRGARSKPVAANLAAISEALNKPVEELTVRAVLDVAPSRAAVVVAARTG